MPARLSLLSLLLVITSAVVLGTPDVSDADFPVEVRQPDAGAEHHPVFGAVYAPCVSPNTVTRDGLPACVPAVRSTCVVRSFDVDVTGRIEYEPWVQILLDTFLSGGSEECRTGEYSLDVGLRTTLVGRLSGDPNCSSGQCTIQDTVARASFRPRSSVQERTLDFPLIDPIDPTYEIMGMTLVAPDGLPLFGTVGLVGNLTPSYQACTSPEPIGSGDGCDLVPRAAGCDFETGSLTWMGAGVHATLRDLSGASPLCTTGLYRFEGTVRSTQNTCGTIAQPELCTLADRTLATTLTANGKDLDSDGFLGLGQDVATELLAGRVIDPTGAPIAAVGVTGIRALVEPRIEIKNGQLRLRAVVPMDVPVDGQDRFLDPTLAGGMTVHIAGPDGPLYAVTIPPAVWQLQPPIGSRFGYRDPDGMLAGVRKATLKRVKKVATGGAGYKLDLLARGVDLVGHDVSGLTVNVVVARPTSATPHRSQAHRTCVLKGAKLGCK